MDAISRRKSIIQATAFLLLHFAFATILLGLLLVCAPKAERVFQDFNTMLPDVTVLLIDISLFVAKYWPIVLPGVAIVDCGMLSALYALRWIAAAKTWGYSVLLGEMLFIGCGFLAVLMPLTALLTNLSAGPGTR